MTHRKDLSNGINQLGKFRIISERLLINIIIGNGFEPLHLRSIFSASDFSCLVSHTPKVPNEQRWQNLIKNCVAKHMVFFDMLVR